MSEIPTIDELKERHNVSDDNICLEIDRGDWRGICGPDVDDSLPTDSAPYPYDAVGTVPDTAGEAFASAFDAKVDAVFTAIEDSDDPIDTILELDPDELAVE